MKTSNFKNLYTHKFHLVSVSPWPFLISWNLLLFMMNFIKMIHHKSMIWLIFCTILILFILFQWWRDTSREHTIGEHSISTYINLKMGFLLFILSEIFFFLSFFWTYFHSSLNPFPEIGSNWPPMNIISLNPSFIPFLNTTILLSSSITVTIAHHMMLNKKFKLSMIWLFITITLGAIFTFFQLFEYFYASFSFSDSVYGSIFFMATGFHGLHVIIGTLFLLIAMIRMYLFHYSPYNMLSFEFSIWYWHFVDTIWLFLFMLMY
uniref:cytochrome c oxidase subunit III n=1 Tax=Sirex nitobei TaxID=1602346 RepID=UPI0023D80C72|nr:cytochrome c oxidase subunit III [Sirex nitobei]WDR47213.1 cytochrome c oxidase subunit III [Sirex nitobei]